MNRTYAVALLLVGIALAVASTTLNLGVAFSSVGMVLAIFACGALVWGVVRPRRRESRSVQAASSHYYSDLSAVAGCWDLPALVLSDEGAISISDVDEIKQFLAHAAEGYRAQGLVATRPQLERVEQLTDRLTAVDVRWPTFNAAGAEQSSERSHYML
jgi:hypothetical protein